MSDFLLTFFVIFLLFGVFRRWIAAFLMRSISNKLNKEFERMQQAQGFGQRRPEPEGKITVEDTRKDSGRRRTMDSGEYVDYEEVKDGDS